METNNHLPEAPLNGEIHLTAQLPRPSFKERIAQIRLIRSYIEKTGINTKQEYKYVEAGIIQGELGELIAQHGLIPCKRNEKVTDITVRTGSGTETSWCRVECEFGLEDVYSDQIRWWPVHGQALNSSDKSYSIALTSARKNWLIDAFCLGTGDDPEADRNEPRQNNPSTGKLKVQREQPRKVVAKESQEPDVITIEEANWLTIECKRLGLNLQTALSDPRFNVDSVENLNRAGFQKLKAAIARKAAEKQQEVRNQAQVINPTLTEREPGED